MTIQTIEQQIVTEYGVIVGFIKNHAVMVALGELVIIIVLLFKIL